MHPTETMNIIQKYIKKDVAQYTGYNIYTMNFPKSDLLKKVYVYVLSFIF